MREVVIFRNDLFKVSEPFIAQQAGRLGRYRPIYLGRARLGGAPANSTALALSELPGQRRLLARLWQVATRDVRGYERLLAGHRPALIHAHFGVDAVYALPLARRLGIPLITTFHGFDATVSTVGLLRSGSPAWAIYAFRRRQLARNGHLFLCVSEYIRARVLALGFPRDRTHLHYIGIDTRSLLPRAQTEEQSIVLHVARLVEKKGTEYLLRGYAQASSQMPGVRLVIIGEGPLRGRLMDLAGSLGLGDRVTFLRAQPHDEVLAWMRKAAVVAVPSVTAASGDSEGLPIVALEAAALGIPVLGTRHSGIPELVRDGETGYLVPERDTTALAQRLGDLMRDGVERRAMGLRARGLAESRFDLSRQTAVLERYYDQVLQPGPE